MLGHQFSVAVLRSVAYYSVGSPSSEGEATMAKANLTLPDGTTVTIEGTPEEVATVMQRLSSPDAVRSRGTEPRRRASSTPQVKSVDTRSKAKGVTDYVLGLRGEDFFREPRSLNEVKDALAARADIYPTTTLSPALFRLVRKKELRRIKDSDDKQWRYVKP